MSSSVEYVNYCFLLVFEIEDLVTLHEYFKNKQTSKQNCYIYFRC